MFTIADALRRLEKSKIETLERPTYTGSSSVGVGLAVESMKNHTSAEGWEIFRGLQQSGYLLCGFNLPINDTDVRRILEITHPGVLLIQDIREWDVSPGNFREYRARFHNTDVLRSRDDIFKLTIVKDAHGNPPYHADFSRQIGVHAHIHYYHPLVVRRLAGFVRTETMIRTYHTIDTDTIPEFSTKERRGCLLSGAMSAAYPLRQRLSHFIEYLPETSILRHPGYHRRGCESPAFMKTLSRFKISICTASRYGYLLKKLIESVACGCVVITDLPADEIVPEIDGSLVRVHPDISPAEISSVIRRCLAEYDPERQEHLSRLAVARFDYRVETKRIADQIEALRLSYPNPLSFPRASSPSDSLCRERTGGSSD